MKQGSFVVVEGIDASGKGTQYELLLEYCRKHSIDFRTVDFPRYSEFFGKLIKLYLSGAVGPMEECRPEDVALLYACDRFSGRAEINEWLRTGYLVLGNRYVNSNFAHQGARVEGERRDVLLRYIDDVEFVRLSVPRPTLNIFLDVPPEITVKLNAKRGLPQDIAEQNADHQQATYEVYSQLAERPDWVKIDCTEGSGEIKSKEEIHRLILEQLQARTIL